MIGASLALFETVGDLNYRNKAQSIANFMINNETTPTAYGNVLYDGDNSGCGGDCHQFKGPAYRYLAQLYRSTGDLNYYNVLASSANAIWNLARETTNTIFAVNWAGPTQTNVDQGQQNAAVVALNRWADITGVNPLFGVPLPRYEAENATINRIGLEATYAGFRGWGYLAGWNANNQWVRFDLKFPSAGGRTLTFRYAAGAGNASRQISINGNNAFPNQSFANTSSWSSYSNMTVSYYFPAGTNSITVAYNSSLGNANFLNLDYLAVTDLKIKNFDVTPAGVVQLSWDSATGMTYQVQYASPLPTGPWSNLGSAITATGPTTSTTDSTAGNSVRYYRLRSP